MRLNPVQKKSAASKSRASAVAQKSHNTRKVNKKKNARSMRVYAGHIRLLSAFLIVMLISLLLGLGYQNNVYTTSLHTLQGWLVKIGFRVEEVVVQGRVNTGQQDLLKAMQIKRGDPILGMDLQQVRFRLEKLEWVRYATVVRRLPDLLQIKIEERHPIAIWQHHNQFYLVDDDGTAILTKNQHRHYGVLPLVIGEGAPQGSPEILALLNQFPNIQKNLQALSRVRERRWNLYLVGGILVKLADPSLKHGLKTLEMLLKEHRLAVDSVKELDLRTPERYFVKVTPETIKTINNGRKGKIA